MMSFNSLTLSSAPLAWVSGLLKGEGLSLLLFKSGFVEILEGRVTHIYLKLPVCFQGKDYLVCPSLGIHWDQNLT